MLNRFIVLLFLFVTPLLINAQSIMVVKGKIVDEKSNIGLSHVHIKVHQRNILNKSNSKGEYIISYPNKKGTVLVFSHTGYETIYEPILIAKDTLILNIKLKQKVEQLPVFEFEEGKPITVFKSTKISIADYEFYEDKFLFLVYGNRLNKDSEIYLVDKDENIIATHFIPGEPVELYNDYLGNINLICKNEIYRVQVFGNTINLYKLPLEEFNQLIKPIVDTLDRSVVFSDFLAQFPRFKYYAFDREDTTVRIIREVVHKDMDWRYNFEYHFLSNADKQFAKRMAKKLRGFDKYDVAAQMTGFANSFLFEEVYAPLFIINDTINIFDHYENKIWKYINDTVLTDSVDFSYHKPAKKNSWKKQLIMDEVNGGVYALFNKNGFYYLKKINTSSGKIISERKLYYQYAEKIKVKDGFIYYTYKPTQSLTKKFLFKEPY